MPKRTAKLELDGVVNIVEFVGRKRVATHQIDSKIILKVLKVALVSGIGQVAATKRKP